MSEKLPLVVVAIDFSDEIIERIQSAAPTFRVERHFPDVPEAVWKETEILLTVRTFPTPDQAPELRWIQFPSAGVDRFLDVEIIKSGQVTVTNAAGMHAVQISEYCLMMMLAFNYQLPLMEAYQRNSEWPPKQHEIFKPMTLRGKTLGIVGYGSIGRELARITNAMGMRVLASKNNLKKLDNKDHYTEPETGDVEAEIPDRIYPSTALASMTKECDFVVVITPLTEATRHSINAEIFEAMKETAVFINVARGEVVDEDAMIKALKEGKIAGAGLDVFAQEPLPSDSPLWQMPNVLMSPHVAGNIANYHEKAAEVFIENLQRYAKNKPLLNRVNLERGY